VPFFFGRETDRLICINDRYKWDVVVAVHPATVSLLVAKATVAVEPGDVTG
jgi:hypothetical protein